MESIELIASEGAETPEGEKKVEWHINSLILNKLLIALNECSEWGRVAILTQLARLVLALDLPVFTNRCHPLLIILLDIKPLMSEKVNISASALYPSYSTLMEVSF